MDATRYDDNFERDAHRAVQAYKVGAALKDTWSESTDEYSRDINIDRVKEDFAEANVFCMGQPAK